MLSSATTLTEIKIAIITRAKNFHPFFHLDGFISSVLKAVHIPILEEEECRTVFGTAFTKNMICAGVMEGKKDACRVRKLVLSGKEKK